MKTVPLHKYPSKTSEQMSIQRSVSISVCPVHQSPGIQAASSLAVPALVRMSQLKSLESDMLPERTCQAVIAQ